MRTVSTTTDISVRPAIEVLENNFVFPNGIAGFPEKLSDFPDLKIGRFTTNDGVELSYWVAGQGQPLVCTPGWSAHGAEYINLMFLLSKTYRVLVLDPRNQGLSQHVPYGGRIARFAMDLKDFGEHLGLTAADYIGWSMGAAVIWSFIDLFGTGAIRKAVFVDEPISIYAHADWSEQERLDAGGTTTSPERMVAGFIKGGPLNSLLTDMKVLYRAGLTDAAIFVNSKAFAENAVKTDPDAIGRVLFDHIVNDWRDVITYKIDIPVAIFTGEESTNLPSQRWAAATIPNAKLFVYGADEQGDHFLMFKNPTKFASDLSAFLNS